MNRPSKVRCWRDDAVVILFVSGALDVETSDDVRGAVRECAAGSAASVVIDCADVDRIDSAGLALLARTGELLRAQGRFFGIAAEDAPALRRMLDLAGLDRRFAVFDTFAEAITAAG